MNLQGERSEVVPFPESTGRIRITLSSAVALRIDVPPTDVSVGGLVLFAPILQLQ